MSGLGSWFSSAASKIGRGVTSLANKAGVTSSVGRFTRLGSSIEAREGKIGAAKEALRKAEGTVATRAEKLAEVTRIQTAITEAQKQHIEPLQKELAAAQKEYNAVKNSKLASLGRIFTTKGSLSNKFAAFRKGGLNESAAAQMELNYRLKKQKENSAAQEKAAEAAQAQAKAAQNKAQAAANAAAKAAANIQASVKKIQNAKNTSSTLKNIGNGATGAAVNLTKLAQTGQSIQLIKPPAAANAPPAAANAGPVPPSTGGAKSRKFRKGRKANRSRRH